MRLFLLATLLSAVLAAGAAVLGAPTATSPASLPDPKVSLPKNSELEEVLQLLEGSAGGVAVADAGTARRVLQANLTEVPLSQALDRISRDFDRGWLRRGSAIVLQSRLRDAQDDPFLELEELRRAAKDWATLVRPFAPRIKGRDYISLQSNFLQSLTPAQMRLALGEGLPIASMAAAQRQAILQINAEHCWDDADRELSRAWLCFEGWDRLYLEQLRPENPYSDMTIRLEAVGGDGVHVDKVRLDQCRAAPPKSDGLIATSATGKPPAGLGPIWRLPTRKTTLAGLVQNLAREGGPEVEIPDYARNRPLWVYSSSGRRWDVLLAVCDLWNWELTGADGKYRLDRPVLKPATDAIDLHAKMRRAVPPLLWFQARALGLESTTEHIGRDTEGLLKEIEQREGPGWTRVRITSLSPRAQLCLANGIAWRQYYTWWSSHGRWEKPRPYVAAPERAIFFLSGELGPGRHPCAEIAGLDEEGKLARWGWFVDTAKYEPAPPKGM